MSRRCTGRTVVLAVVGLFASLGITGWVVWDVASGNGNVFSSGDKSAYAKCNGLDKVEHLNTGAIPATYILIDKRYTCRGLRGNTPQRVTQIIYTYAADPDAGRPNAPLGDHLAAELSKGGWVTPGIPTIDSQATSLHLTKEPLVGLSYHVVNSSRTSVFQLIVFARDQWQPASPDSRAPKDVVVSVATIRRYASTAHRPTFVPAGYTRWVKKPYQRIDELDARSLTSEAFELTGGSGDVNPGVSLRPASPDEFDQLCHNNSCVETGKTAAGKPIYSGDDGNALYSQIAETFVEINQLTNLYSKPQVGFGAGLKILASMEPAK